MKAHRDGPAKAGAILEGVHARPRTTPLVLHHPLEELLELEMDKTSIV